jgi:hypothetical protein
VELRGLSVIVDEDEVRLGAMFSHSVPFMARSFEWGRETVISCNASRGRIDLPHIPKSHHLLFYSKDSDCHMNITISFAPRPAPKGALCSVEGRQIANLHLPDRSWFGRLWDSIAHRCQKVSRCTRADTAVSRRCFALHSVRV